MNNVPAMRTALEDLVQRLSLTTVAHFVIKECLSSMECRGWTTIPTTIQELGEDIREKIISIQQNSVASFVVKQTDRPEIVNVIFISDTLKDTKEYRCECWLDMTDLARMIVFNEINTDKLNEAISTLLDDEEETICLDPETAQSMTTKSADVNTTL